MHCQRSCLPSQQRCSYHSCLLQLFVESSDCSCMPQNQLRQPRACSTPQQPSQFVTEFGTVWPPTQSCIALNPQCTDTVVGRLLVVIPTGDCQYDFANKTRRVVGDPLMWHGRASGYSSVESPRKAKPVNRSIASAWASMPSNGSMPR